MFFSRIRGLWREGNHIFIRAEYRNIKFHIHEIENIRIVDSDNQVCTVDDLPVRSASIFFLLKSGRKKTCHVQKLTKRKYKYLTNLLDTDQR